MKDIHNMLLIPYQKWNRRTHKYDFYFLPAEYNLKTYCEDLSELVNCAQCYKELPMGECYTSLEVHDILGFGYGVCNECYEREWERRRMYKDED